MTEALDFLTSTGWEDLPDPVRDRARMCLLDLIGTAAAGSSTPLSRIIRDHAHSQFGGSVPMLFDGRCASPAGAALAGGMTIDAVDAHDGWNPVKGHIGCGLLPAILAVAGAEGVTDGAEIMTTLATGYEIAGRLGAGLHETAADYHTSGAWIAVAAAAACGRLIALDRDRLRHALGIAEFHGPRSQMMRCIDHPTMVKDGSGWGAMAGVSAAYLARDGFTGAPALTLESAETASHWTDLGQRWIILEQYFKPYPICRWAQAPVEGVLHLMRAHQLRSDEIDHIEIATFDEAIRLATSVPRTTEEAQYSTSFPCAAAAVCGTVGLAEISPAAFEDAEVLRLSQGTVMTPDPTANAAFPQQRYATVTLHLRDGRVVRSGQMSPRWTAEKPPAEQEIRDKFHDLADPIIGPSRADAIATAVGNLPQSPLTTLTDHLHTPA